MPSSNATCVTCATLSCSDTPLAVASAFVTFITYFSGVLAAISVYYNSLLNGASELGELVRSFEQSAAQWNKFKDRLMHTQREEKTKFNVEGFSLLEDMLEAAGMELDEGHRMFEKSGIMDVLKRHRRGWRVPFIGSRRNRRLKLGWEWHNRGKELTVQSFKIKRSIADFQAFMLDSQQEDLEMFGRILKDMEMNFEMFGDMLKDTHQVQMKLAKELIGKKFETENQNLDTTTPTDAPHTPEADQQASEVSSQHPEPDNEEPVDLPDDNGSAISPKHSESNSEEVIELSEKGKATMVSSEQRNSLEDKEQDILATLARPPQIPSDKDHVFIAEKPKELRQTRRLREQINAIQRRASTWSSSVSGPNKMDDSAGRPQKNKETRRGSTLSGDVPQEPVTWKELREGYDDLYDA